MPFGCVQLNQPGDLVEIEGIETDAGVGIRLKSGLAVLLDVKTIHSDNGITSYSGNPIVIIEETPAGKKLHTLGIGR